MADGGLNPFEGGGGPPAVKFGEVGDAVEGTIVRVDYREARDRAGNVKRFPDGNVKPVVVITLDPGDGELVRDFVQGRPVSQLREKVYAVEGPGNSPQAGAHYRREFTGLGEVKAGNAEKLFDIDYDRSTGSNDKELV